MKAAIKAEFRKLFTVRSTYIVSAGFLIITALAGYFIEGGSSTDSFSQFRYRNAIFSGTPVISLAGAIVCILLMAHEYRYNTIVYTMTAANRRIKVLIAKMIAGLTYSLVMGLICAATVIIAMRVGLAVHHVTLVPQTLDLVEVLGKHSFYIGMYSMVGLLYAVAFRNIVVPFIFIFLVPGTVEGLLGLILKENGRYLPFSALGSVVGNTPQVGGYPLSPFRGGMIALAYFVVAWAITIWLFQRRDAN